ncbi:putative membrane protein YhfC [Paraburkholderia bannensis]|uniref:Putative membrane protein YhfC n=1 Tax=Paraburkholderia bannensis TaxID=765414 RepID=A0A7W9TUE7_9BURK|nr:MULTISPECIES: YhfC family intramembrane metalloprotease [Paraburkholderia]MBB3256643.1 putative membrane protein YhfC [Paraburkholderia sp. WP4_3_2]MBB6101642.1 putative membrane protein YhfC [Paraburkholderia bannensis]
MHVDPVTLVCLSLATLFVAFLPISLYRRLRRPFQFDWRDTIAGIAIFALFATVIERALNGFLLHENAQTAELLTHPIAFVAYGALVAGVCEEVGRYIAMRMLARRGGRLPGLSNTPPKDSTGLAYGIGHGGAEAWFVGVLVQLQWIFFAVLANRGDLDTHLTNLTMDSVLRVHLILATLSPLHAGVFALERTAALVFQIGLSVLMWRGVQAGRKAILPIAILVHALIDVPAAMFQARLVPLVAVDALYVSLAIVAAIVLFKTCGPRRSQTRAA